MKTKVVSRVLSLFAAAAVAVSMSVASVSAAPSDPNRFDTFDRTEVKETSKTGVGAPYWVNCDKGGSMEDGALRLDFKQDFYFGEGANVSPIDFKYMVIRIKGASGGEGAFFKIVTSAMVTYDEKDDAPKFEDLIAPNGKKIPAITTEYQDIYIDLMKNNWLAHPDEDNGSGFQGMHFNFFDGEGTIWIDEIYFTNEDNSVPAEEGGDGTQSGETPAVPAITTNPESGDVPTGYVVAALVVSAAVLVVTRKKR